MKNKLARLHRLFTAERLPIQGWVVLVSLISSVSTVDAATQSIDLKQGWNLIGFNLTPDAPSPASVFQSLGSNFMQASTLDNATKKWTSYRHANQPDAATSNALDAMPNIAMGKGYLVQVSTPATLTVTGTAPSAAVPMTLYPGQNLVCPAFPGFNAPIGLSDLLKGLNDNLHSAHIFDGTGYRQFTNNGVTDDIAFSLNPGQALMIESTSQLPILFTPAIQQQPLVFFDRSTPFVVEAPINGAGGTSIINLPVKLTRTYTGPISFEVAGTARISNDYLLPTAPVTDGVGSFNVTSGVSSLSLPFSITQRSAIQSNSNVTVTLRRPAETGVSDSASLPQFVQVKITDGMKGVYEGILKNQSASSMFEAQGFRVALRESGVAIFEPSEGGMISSRFVLPFTIGTDGVPQFSSTANVSLSSQNSLGRIVNLNIQPTTTGALPAVTGAPPAYEVQLNLTLNNLVARGPVLIAATLTLSQANAPVSNP